jgi:hypothetical protein
MSRMINLAQQARAVHAIPPFSMKGARAANIFLLIGVSAAAPTALLIEACTNAAGDNAEAIAYHLYSEETASGDTFGEKEEITAAGKTLSANNNIMYMAWVDSSWLPDGKPWLRIRVTNGTNSVIAAAIAILLGVDNVGDPSLGATLIA